MANGMIFYVSDTSFKKVFVFEAFESAIWTERYSSWGDFEWFTLASTNLLDVIKENYYITFPGSDREMIVEDRRITADAENGTHLTITGRSLESILDRRIIWNQTLLDGGLQDGIFQLLMQNAIAPSDPSRKINNLILQRSTDPLITSLSIKAQFTGTNLYDAIKVLCDINGIGFKIVRNEANQFVFSLYAGADRSYAQTALPYVIFSPGYENVINNDYYESARTDKTVTLVAGEGEGAERRTTTVAAATGAGSDLSRREMFTDARDISSNSGEIPDAEYISQLTNRGKEYLAENVRVKEFQGQVDASRMFVYGEDFNMGDIVQVEDEYGISARSRVTEFIRSQDESGLDSYPTFSIVA